MPLYLFNAPKGVLTDAAKAAIAADSTRIYCEVTGAPALYVNAFFFEELPMVPLQGRDVFIRAGTCKGWSQQQKDLIAERLTASKARHAGIDLGDIGISFHDTPARWAMEGGDIVAEPGEDAAWLAAREAKHAGLAG